jgi:hypothetical protein
MLYYQAMARQSPHKRTSASKTGKTIVDIVNKHPKRNDSLFDNWSIVHLCTGIAMGWVLSPFVALVLMVLWEPLEIFVLSPILARYGIIFGYETLRNSLSDIFFDTMGIIIGAYIIGSIFEPPFFLL